MKGFFEKDSVLKLISFVVAVLLWFYIIAVVDPSVDITVKDIPVRFTNQNLLAERGLCLVNESKTTVELKIRGSRKKIANIESKNIYANADLSNITKTGTFSIPIAISIPYEYDEIVSKKPYNASVVIDRIVTASKDVKLITTGSVANGYIAGEVASEIKKVSLKGAQSLIDRISYVAAEINYDDRAAAISDTVDLFFLDADGRRINTNNFIYEMVTMDTETIDVFCPVMKLKTVPVNVATHSANDVKDYKISVQPSNVTIYAENEILDTVDEIFTEKINLDEITEANATAKLILPEGVSLRDGITEVNIKAEKRN
ncbi:MAG: hypothetical protein IKW64_06015 [Clostridia bacterium]|nr:hypothetical protein [Clostridia bacterium]